MNARIILSARLIVVVSCGTASASIILPDAPLNLVRTVPDFAVTNSVVTAYSTSTSLFTVGGGLTGYTPPVGSPVSAINGTTGTGLTLLANIGNLGGFVSGTLTLNGVIPALSVVPVQNLLTANLTAFGYSGLGNKTIFEFRGVVTGGAEASAFGSVGSPIGVIINPGANCTYAGTYSANFAGSGAGSTVDVFAIPEPCTLGVLALGGGLAILRRRSAR
ncbi:MAG: PEP-CTERM sorting domain-containing protein [Planctomycetota bacterium]|nr:PEP-CTERM sorting domain-containing protein [Planctomycetota bacterium]